MFDILPHNALDGLTAEDLRLLLNGVSDINVDTLVSYTTFLDETGATSFSNTNILSSDGEASSTAETSTPIVNSEAIAKLKRWFWHVVRSMDVRQRQDLVSICFNLHILFYNAYPAYSSIY